MLLKILLASSYHEPVGDSDLVEEALFPVNKKCVRNPDLSQEGPVQRQLLQAARVVAEKQKKVTYKSSKCVNNLSRLSTQDCLK